MTQTTFCKRHPSAESNVACGRCGDPICPRCMVHAPVGIRCPDCGKSNPVPTFNVTGAFLARGIGAGVAVALICGIAFAAATYIAYENLPYNFSRFVAPLLVATLGIPDRSLCQPCHKPKARNKAKACRRTVYAAGLLVSWYSLPAKLR